MSEELKLLHAEDSLRKGPIQKLSPLKSTHGLRSRFSPAVRVVVCSHLCPWLWAVANIFQQILVAIFAKTFKRNCLHKCIKKNRKTWSGKNNRFSERKDLPTPKWKEVLSEGGKLSRKSHKLDIPAVPGLLQHHFSKPKLTESFSRLSFSQRWWEGHGTSKYAYGKCKFLLHATVNLNVKTLWGHPLYYQWANHWR